MKMTLSVLAALAVAAPAHAHLAKRIHRNESRAALHAAAQRDYNHSLYVCKRGWGKPKREHCRSLRWLQQLLERTAPPPPVVATDWVAKQIYAATVIGREASKDPWPECSDPIWNGASSWQTTVNCENSGSWYDSPGRYRCGLQFDPMWERRFGRLCPG